MEHTTNTPDRTAYSRTPLIYLAGDVISVCQIAIRENLQHYQ